MNHDTRQPSRSSPQALAELARRFGERFVTSPAIRERHGQDESWHLPAPPDAVIFAESTEEVAAIATIGLLAVLLLLPETKPVPAEHAAPA